MAKQRPRPNFRATVGGFVDQAEQAVVAGARKGKDAAISLVDSSRHRPGNSQEMIAAHIAQQRNVIVISRMIPDTLRIQHSSELVLAMYRKHIGVQNDEKGVYYCAFGKAGYLAGIDVSVNPLGLILPSFSLPFGIDIETTITVTAKGGGINHLLLLLHRGFPKGMHMYESTHRGTNGQLVNQYMWQTVLPITFMALSGWEKRFEGKITVDANASAGFPSINIDGHLLSLDLVSLSAGMNAGGRFYKLNDRLPGWYASINDPSLETDFTRFANPDKDVLKRLVNEWRKYLRDEVFQHLKTSTYPNIKEFINLLNQRLTLDVSISKGSGIGSSEKVVNWLNKLGHDLNALFEANLSGLKPQQWQEVSRYIVTARDTIIAAKWQADWAKTSGIKLPVKTIYGMWNATQLQKATSRCRADITVWALGGSASGGIGVSASESVSLGQFIKSTDLVDAASASASLKLEAGVAINGNARFMSSRYQTEAISSKQRNLILTQETKITYTQIIWDYQVGGAGSLPFNFSGGYEKEGKGLLKNDMNYYATTAYWEPIKHSQGVLLLPGSGLSLGTSISLKALADIKRNPASANIKRYPYFLGLTKGQFLAFVNSIPDSLYESKFMQEHPYVLVESSFGFLTEQYVQLQLDNEIEPLSRKFKDFWKSRVPGSLVALESIRCRVRLGSDLDQTRTAFKLGVEVAGVGGGVELTKIRQAGNMFIQDLYRLDFVIPRPVASGVGPAGQQAGGAAAIPVALHPDQKVPAVVLLPHTFQID